MIDFTKILVTDKSLIENFNTNPLLVWNDKRENLSHFDFEVVQTRETKIYKGILFCFHPHKLEILIRPHYYFNDNEHNANDFNALDCIRIISDFIKTFDIKEPQEFKIINLEYGLNFLSPIDIKNLITFLYSHQRNEFKTDTGLAFSKKAYRATKHGKINPHKIIKAYAKGLQFPQIANKDLFRFEVKSKKSRYINNLGIKDISDLLRLRTYKTLSNELKKEFERVLIIHGNASFENLTPKEKQKLERYLNTHTWYKFLQSKNRNQFARHKERYFDLLNKTPKNIHTELKKRIADKLKILESGAISHPPQKIKSGAISHSNIMGNCTTSKKISHRICLETGLNISMQKDNSFLLSHTGLKYYLETDRKVFDKVKRKYLTKVWENANPQTQIKEIAHNIRNHHNNKNLKQKWLYPEHQTRLFKITA